MVRQIGQFISLAALLCVVSQRSFSADNKQFTGSLEAITTHSVWVKEANGVLRFARLPGAGAISAPALAGRYKIGDQVLVKAFVIDRSRDDEEGEWFDLEATSLDYLRPASATELASALASSARRRKGNLLRAPSANDASAKSDPPVSVSLKTLQLPDPSAAPAKNDPAAILDRARALTQKYLAALPNFNADETSKNYHSPISNAPKWQLQETLQSEVSFQGNNEKHRNVVRNGEPWNDLWEHLSPRGPSSQNGTLSNVFGGACNVTIEFIKHATEAGVPVLLYHFTAPPDSCFGYTWGELDERYPAGRSGELAIAEADSLFRRLEITTTGLPKGYRSQAGETRATWDYVTIGEERYLLPITVQSLEVRSWVGGGYMTLTIIEFKNHRHFEAFSNITYK